MLSMSTIQINIYGMVVHWRYSACQLSFDDNEDRTKIINALTLETMCSDLACPLSA